MAKQEKSSSAIAHLGKAGANSEPLEGQLRLPLQRNDQRDPVPPRISAELDSNEGHLVTDKDLPF